MHQFLRTDGKLRNNNTFFLILQTTNSNLAGTHGQAVPTNKNENQDHYTQGF